MKKIYSLLLAFNLVISVNAQTEKSKVHHTSKSNASHSGGSSVNHYNSNSKSNHTEHSSRSTTSGTYRESISSNDHHEHSSFDRVEKWEAKQKPTEVKPSTTDVKGTNEATGGIKRVDEKPEIYQEPKKDEIPVAGTGVLPGDLNSSGENTDENEMKKGLSQTTTTYRNNGIRINGVIITCDEMVNAGRNRRGEILSAYEYYDLSQIKRCMTEFPSDDRWKVTCEEFENSDEARKKHILIYEEFYNIDKLKNCESYKKFKETLSVDTEE